MAAGKYCESRSRALCVVCVIVMFVCVWNAERLGAQTAAQCKQERRLLVDGCKQVLIRRPPSAYCCQRIRATHINCVCSVITPQLAALIDVNYGVKVIQGCRRQVPRHFKCGSITTP